MTGFGALDLAVGDCDGVVTLFSRQQILSKRDLGSAITDITIFSDLGKDDLHTRKTSVTKFSSRLVGGCEIIAGDITGTITGFQQHDALWKINIAEESAKLATLGLVSIQIHYVKRKWYI